MIKHHRAQHLEAQLRDVRIAREARAFVQNALSLERCPEETAWLDWISAYADEIDPLRQSLKLPKNPEATAKNLEPFLSRGYRFS